MHETWLQTSILWLNSSMWYNEDDDRIRMSSLNLSLSQDLIVLRWVVNGNGNVDWLEWQWTLRCACLFFLWFSLYFYPFPQDKRACYSSQSFLWLVVVLTMMMIMIRIIVTCKLECSSPLQKWSWTIIKKIVHLLLNIIFFSSFPSFCIGIMKGICSLVF